VFVILRSAATKDPFHSSAVAANADECNSRFFASLRMTTLFRTTNDW
jgi:hypothetical protein